MIVFSETDWGQWAAIAATLVIAVVSGLFTIWNVKRQREHEKENSGRQREHEKDMKRLQADLDRFKHRDEHAAKKEFEVHEELAKLVHEAITSTFEYSYRVGSTTWHDTKATKSKEAMERHAELRRCLQTNTGFADRDVVDRCYEICERNNYRINALNTFSDIPRVGRAAHNEWHKKMIELKKAFDAAIQACGSNREAEPGAQ